MIQKFALLFLSVAFLNACHPAWFFLPPDLSASQFTEVKVKPYGSNNSNNTEVIWDKNGVPHIFAANELDAAYSIGFVHARDRLFQIDSLRHAGHGKLSEFFDTDLTEADRSLRFLKFNIVEQYEALSHRDKELLLSYAAGVNAGADYIGRTSLEHKILRTSFEDFSVMDSMVIARLQTWDLAANVWDELVRVRASSVFKEDDPRLQLFLSSMPTGDTPIVPHIETAQTDSHTQKKSFRPLPSHVDWSVLGPEATGASNSWVVSGSRTQSGFPVLCNDPHLTHRAPGTFYLLHVETPESTAVGASMVGFPAVLIGHSRYAAWGFTVSFADAQDLVEIVLADNGKSYVMDGATIPLNTQREVFKKGRSEEGALEEIWYSTDFGPVLPSVYFDEKETRAFVLQWTGFVAGGPNREFISGFRDLAASKNEREATIAASKISITGQNLSMAFTDGTIAYRLATAVPIRNYSVISEAGIPKVTSKSHLWQGFLSQEEKPQLTNPSEGFLIASNQRVVADTHPLAKWIGGTATEPYRAMQIRKRLTAMFDDLQKPDANKLASIAMDSTLAVGKDLADSFAKFCKGEGEVQKFCTKVTSFNGVFAEDSKEALPFFLFRRELMYQALLPALGEKDARSASRQKLSITHFDALFLGRGDSAARAFLAKANDVSTDDLNAQLVGFGSLAAKAAYTEWNSMEGNQKWGDSHYHSVSSALAKIPVIGKWLFTTKKVPVPGFGSAPRAESGLPVQHGAVLRIVAEMSTPPKVGIVSDLGNSGNWASPNFDDQFELWNKGEFISIPVTRESVDSAAEGKLRLVFH